jgi:hypothetical protein
MDHRVIPYERKAQEKPRPEVGAGSRHSRRPEWRSRIDLAISLAVTQCPLRVTRHRVEPTAGQAICAVPRKAVSLAERFAFARSVASDNDADDGFGSFFQRNWDSQPANPRGRGGPYDPPMQPRGW